MARIEEEDKRMTKWTLCIGSLLLIIGFAGCAGMGSNRAAIDAALVGSDRTPEEMSRDVYRHPGETLAFFGVAPDMTIIELSPGGGWYTHILAPIVRDEGRYIGVTADPEIYAEFPQYVEALKKYPQKVANDPELYGENAKGTWLLNGDIGEEDSVDMVLGMRFLHGWISKGFADKAIARLHGVLKPGGTFAIVQHRADEADSRESVEIAATGYVKQSYVIELMEQHGFELAAESEINANPKDTRDHPEGVWTLPPGLRLGDQDKNKYLAIGESDRMTLKFTKAN